MTGTISRRGVGRMSAGAASALIAAPRIARAAFPERTLHIMVGFAAGGTFVLMLTLPPLLSPPADVHRVSAAMLTIAYACAVIVPVFSGLAWDITGAGALAFLPIGACALVIIALAPSIRFAPRDSPAETG